MTPFSTVNPHFLSLAWSRGASAGARVSSLALGDRPVPGQSWRRGLSAFLVFSFRHPVSCLPSDRFAVRGSGRLDDGNGPFAKRDGLRTDARNDPTYSHPALRAVRLILGSRGGSNFSRAHRYTRRFGRAPFGILATALRAILRAVSFSVSAPNMRAT